MIKNNNLFNVLFILFILTTTSCINLRNNKNYFEIKDRTGGFSINFPVEPIQETSQIETDIGEVQMISYSCGDDVCAMVVMYCDYNNLDVENTKPYEMLEDVKSGYTNNLSLTVTKSVKKELKKIQVFILKPKVELKEKKHTQ